MNSLFSNLQPVPKPIIASPFFMFLSDQQKANKTQNADIKLLDLAANAIKEWDQVMTIQDEYTAKFFEESEKVQSGPISNPPTLSPAEGQITFAFDSQGKSDVYDQVRRENPDLRITDITKLIAMRWGQMDQQRKEYYEKKNQEAKALYERQIALFEATYGKIEKKRRGIKTLGGGSSLFQMNHPNPADNSDSD